MCITMQCGHSNNICACKYLFNKLREKIPLFFNFSTFSYRPVQIMMILPFNCVCFLLRDSKTCKHSMCLPIFSSHLTTINLDFISIRLNPCGKWMIKHLDQLVNSKIVFVFFCIQRMFKIKAATNMRFIKN